MAKEVTDIEIIDAIVKIAKVEISQEKITLNDENKVTALDLTACHISSKILKSHIIPLLTELKDLKKLNLSGIYT